MANGRKTGGGSRKGKPNKVNAALKDMILTALAEAGGVRYLKDQAGESPSAFLSLLGKVLPTEVKNADGETFKIQGFDRVITRPSKDTNG